MFKEQKSIFLFIVLMLLAGMACSTTQRFSRFIGVDGEAQDASHEQWTDLIEADSPAEANIEAERSESSDSAGAQEIPAVDASLENTTLHHQIKKGDVTLELIEVSDGGTQGEMIELTVTNQSGEELVFEIPAGLVFSPVESNEQDLMVLDAVVVNLDPGETMILSPYVICIESSATTPSADSVYQVGYLESGDLLAFAECVDEEEAGTLTQDDIGLQFAVWAIANNGDVLEIPELTEAEGGALSGLIEEWENTGMMDTMEDMILIISEDWLQSCDISVGGEE
ncbi:MAG: hypothetical protein MUO54_06895 [Anaerolineales bacterium]|nr:hypothetical protein [Anaerolineales bacterium]